MTKIDNRKTYYCVLDTETCPIVPSDKVDAHNMLVYDIGYRIIDKQGTCYLERSFVVNEIFFGEYEKMLSSYYADKLPQYFKDIAEGTRVRKSFWEIRKILKEDLEKFNCSIISAHNAYFDYTALATTTKYLFDTEKKIYFFPFGTKIWDTMKMARDTICKYKTYDYYTKKGQKSATAENLYKYLTNNKDFKESHTGLEDTKIESEILVRCLASHRKMRKNLFSMA